MTFSLLSANPGDACSLFRHGPRSVLLRHSSGVCGSQRMLGSGASSSLKHSSGGR